jgi:hypothetical protein
MNGSRFGCFERVKVEAITPYGTGLIIAVGDVGDDGKIESYVVQFGKADCVDADGKFDQAAWLKICPGNGPTIKRKVPDNSIVPLVNKSEVTIVKRAEK